MHTTVAEKVFQFSPEPFLDHSESSFTFSVESFNGQDLFEGGLRPDGGPTQAFPLCRAVGVVPYLVRVDLAEFLVDP